MTLGGSIVSERSMWRMWCFWQDFYAFACVCGLDVFVLSDSRHTCCFPSQRTDRQALYPSSIISPVYFCLHYLPPLLGSILPYVLQNIWGFHRLHCNAQLEYFSTEASGVAMLTNTACMNYLIPCVAVFVCLVIAMPFCVFVCLCVYPGSSTNESFQLCSPPLLLGRHFFSF